LFLIVPLNLYADLRCSYGPSTFATQHVFNIPFIQATSATYTLAVVDGAQTFSAAQTFGANITINNGFNTVLGTGAGTQIGTVNTQKLGFLGASPASQQTGGALTASTVVYGSNEATMLQRAYNALRTFGLLA
jgi:hypothetical protein